MKANYILLSKIKRRVRHAFTHEELIYWGEIIHPSLLVLTSSKGYGNTGMAKTRHKWSSNIPGDVLFELH